MTVLYYDFFYPRFGTANLALGYKTPIRAHSPGKRIVRTAQHVRRRHRPRILLELGGESEFDTEVISFS